MPPVGVWLVWLRGGVILSVRGRGEQRLTVTLNKSDLFGCDFVVVKSSKLRPVAHVFFGTENQQ